MINRINAQEILPELFNHVLESFVGNSAIKRRAFRHSQFRAWSNPNVDPMQPEWTLELIAAGKSKRHNQNKFEIPSNIWFQSSNEIASFIKQAMESMIDKQYTSFMASYNLPTLVTPIEIEREEVYVHPTEYRRVCI